MNSKNKLSVISKNINRLFLAGFIIVLIVSIFMVTDKRFNVFLVYKYGSLDFWQNINPYNNWQHNLDRYLYGPVFSVFFTVFAILPAWMGAVAWSLFSFSLFCFAVSSLPNQQFPLQQKKFLFLFLFPIVITDIFYFQSNVLVASLFVLAYSNLEKNKSLTGIVIILFSGFGKIYGLIQLGTLLFYKKYGRAILLAGILSCLLFFLPLIRISSSGFIDYYLSWFEAIDQRHNPLDFEVIYRLLYFVGLKAATSYITAIQLLTLISICIFTLLNYKSFNNSNFRAKVLGVVMGWIILFSTTAEKHTYVIAMAGMLLWYISGKKNQFSTLLIWLNFVVIIIIPIDVIIPKSIMNWLFYRLDLNLFVYTGTWLYMYFNTFIQPLVHPIRNKMSLTGSF